MTEFKQIIGRGTRVNEKHGKTFFTIMDLEGVSRLFADPDFDGDPIQDEDYESFSDNEKDFVESGEKDEDFGLEEEEVKEKRIKYYVDDVEVFLINKRVQYLDSNGKLITESLTDYSKNNLKKIFPTLESFLKSWNSRKRKQIIINELSEKGIFFEELKDEVGKDFDEFDLICHIAFDQKPLTKQERINNVKKRDYFAKYSEKAKEVLNILLNNYKDKGYKDIEDIKILKLEEFKKIGSANQIVKLFGSKEEYLDAVAELESELCS